MAQAPRTPTADESSKNGKRSSRSISTFAQNSSNSNEFKAVLRASRTFSHSSPLISIGNCRARAVNQQETDGEVIDSSLKDPIKSECFQWGCGKKILEKPKLLRGKNIKTVQSGGSHTIALLEDGTVYTWGDGRCGQLGLGKDINHTEQPKRIEDFEEEVAEIYAGFTQSAVITKSGRLYVCGLIAEDMRWTLENIPSFDNVKILSIAFGPSCIAVLGSTIRVDLLKNTTSLGPSTIWVWGHSRKGHLGMGDRRNILEPCELESLSQCNVTQISSGEHHMGAVTADHRVFIWGDGPVNGMEGPFNEPTEVLGLEMKGAIKVVCGNRNTFVLTADGSVYSWGLGRYGALGHGNTESYEFPGKINSFHDKKIVGIDSGGNHACAWTADGRVYSWGSGRNFALGHSDGEDRLVPHLIEALADGKILLQLSCGSSDTVVLVERDIIAVEYRGQINRLPVHNYPFVGHVIRKLATHHNKRVEDLFLLDHSNTPLKVGDAIRDLKMVCRQGLTLVSKPSMYDYECESLILFPPDAERIKKGCDAIPVVKGGTIPKLIEWLTFPQSCGHEFVSTFLLTYRTFMTSEELIEQLIKRYENPIFPIDEFDSYNIPDYTPQSDDAKRHIIRIRVLNVIKKWLTSYADNFIGYNPAPVIQMIHKFLKSDKTVQQKFERESANIMRVCEQLKNKEDTSGEEHEIPTRAPECPPICEPFHNGPWDIFKYPPEEMARQITIIDYFYYFRKIQPGELIGQAWSKAKKEDQAPNLLRMIHRFNNVSEWVVRVILTGKTQVIRSLCTERMIDIADELFKLNSFNAVMSILSAFSQSSLYRLKSVFEPKNGGISGAALEKLNKLRKIFKVENNMIPYRDLFASLPPPKIPFMGKYLQDLTFIDENPDYLDKEHNIVNFDKRTRLASIISLIQRLQKASYSFTEIPECIEALQNISGFGEDHERTTFKVSKFIEQKTGEVTNDISEIDDPRIREMIHEVTPPVPLSLRRRNLTVLSRTLSTSDYVQ